MIKLKKLTMLNKLTWAAKVIEAITLQIKTICQTYIKNLNHNLRIMTVQTMELMMIFKRVRVSLRIITVFIWNPVLHPIKIKNG